MMLKNSLSQLALLSISLTYFCTYPVAAQVIPDNSLGNENSIVTPNATIKDVPADLIEGGAIRDSNLFHSFSEFNVGNGDAVYFANPDGIANILTRITGNNISEIFGTLGVNGAANLFLLNPNGIVFGENAALDVNGSFLATTADSYIFDNDFVYSATNPEVPPLLTVNIPVGLQMGNNPADIKVRGTGSNLVLDEFGLIRDERTRGLEVGRGNTLALLGGEINLTGGNLTAESGNIELGSVEAGKVTINPQEYGFSLSYEEIADFQDINLTQASSLDTSGNSGGRFQLRGKNISILEESLIVNNTLGNSNGRNSQIVATDNLKFIGTDAGTLPTGIFQFVELGATGNSGEIAIEAGKLEIAQNVFILNSVNGDGYGGDLTINGDLLVIKDGGLIDSGTFGAGDGGNLIINVAETEIIGDSADGFFASGLFSSSEGTGNAGDLTINGDRLVVRDGGLIDSGTFGAGDSGNLNINVTQTEIMGTSADGFFPSGLSSVSEGTGNAGDLTINGDLLVVRDGGQISSAPFAEGDGGNLTINIAQTEVIGTTADGLFPSRLFSTSSGTGNAGNLTINGDRLVVKDGGQISSGTFAEGNGGNLTINVAQTEVIGASADFLSPSRLFAPSAGRGNAGDLNINGDSLVVKDGGQISSGTFGAGDGGNLTINIARTEIIGTRVDGLFSSGLFSASEETGNAGDLTLNSDFVLIKDGGTISSSTKNAGNAGDVDIKAQNIEVTGTSSNGDLLSKIIATSEADTPAGFLEIVTDKLKVTDGAEIAVSNTGLGDAGNLTITADEINLDRNGNLRAEVNQGERGNINLITNNLFLNNNSRIDAQAFNDATGGNISIDNTQNIVLRGNSQINANATRGNGGNIEINTQGYFISPDSLVTASSDFGLDGTVEIDEVNGDRKFELNKLPENIRDLTNLITVTCTTKDNNSVAVIGNGGIPHSPYQTQSLNATWYDLRPVKPEKNEIASLPTPLIEATMTMIDGDGELALVALTPLSTHRWIKSGCQSEKHRKKAQTSMFF